MVPTHQYLTLVFIVLLNAVALLMVYFEYRRSGRNYLRAVTLGQGLILFWHLATFWLIFNPTSVTGLRFATAFVFLASLCYLAATFMARGALLQRPLFPVAGAMFVTILVLDAVLSLDALNWLWVFTTLVLLVTPVVTLFSTAIASRWAVSLLQALVAGCFGTGVIILVSMDPAVGSILYFAMAMSIPAISFLFLQNSLHQSTDEMTRSEQRYREIFESVKDVYYRIGQAGEIEVVSPSVQQFGYRPGQLQDRLLASFFEDPDEFQRHLAAAAASPGQSITFQAAFRDAEGQHRDCEVAFVQVRSESADIAFTGTIRDVHERNLLERQFLDSQRRESLGVLAGGVAHDFNNMLQGVMGHAELLKMPNVADVQKATSVDAILIATRTAGTLCNQLLQYTGKALMARTVINLHDTITDVVSMLAAAGEPHQIKTVLEATDSQVEVDETLMKQVLMNLLTNAAAATPLGDGTICVTTANGSYRDALLPGGHVFGEPHIENPGPYLMIDVTDTGSGIDPGIMHQIFDPFFSTKTAGHGLGLSAVQGILRKHQGVLCVRSEVGAGSTFRVLLPLGSDLVAPPPVMRRLHTGADPTILLADDDPRVLEVVARTLSASGFRVIRAADGVEALAIVRGDPDAIDIILTDVNMPRMDGLQLAREVRAFAPTIAIVLASGYANIAEKLSSSEAVSLRFVAKPFSQRELLAALDEAIAAAQS